MGNEQSCYIEGIGSVRFKMWDGIFKTLENERLVPDLKRNLISLGMLDLNGDSYKSGNDVLRVLRGSMVILKGILKQGLYILQGEDVPIKVVVLSFVKDETEMWDRKLGHIRNKGLQELAKQGILNHHRISNLEFCETYVMGKAHRLKFASTTYKPRTH